MKNVVLVYPKMGMAGSVLVRHLPLSVLYAAVDTIKSGIRVDIVDVRLSPATWHEDIARLVTEETLLVGLSVMTGPPIKNALEISRWLKAEHPDLPVAWGGPHTTFNALEVFDEPSIDFVIKGYGSLPLSRLARRLRGDADAPPFDAIPGLMYRTGSGVREVPPEASFETVDYRDIPYHLVEQDLGHYGQLDSSERIFPMYSALGCPYRCAFCSSPAQYRDMAQKYRHLPAAHVADHVQFVHQKYGATYIYFIDDDSFVNLEHVEQVIDEIQRRGIKVGLGFRGARINEIVRMSDAYLTKLAQAGTNILHIGAESGSQRMLDLMHKDCTVEQIVEVNRKLARHPEIKAAYNWLVGIPGETMEDLRLTRELMMRLIDDNASALIFIPNKYRPLPGTELYALAVQSGYRKPQRLEDWVEIEAEGDYTPPWYSEQQEREIRMIQICSYFIDGKINKVDTGNTLKFRITRLLALFYAPFARLRVRHGISALLLESAAFNFFTSRFR
ncbi:B12-binding domain-containing radical SAM protein [Geomonas subterranea]|uniref:B12-binding domain-containing radical SAM protein n=1 Tax=Geomonas subterranea TaxID=2847989 RepID=UPI001CD5DC17|nr:radical SAM protein [Geomonas fuzhouensis]